MELLEEGSSDGEALPDAGADALLPPLPISPNARAAVKHESPLANPNAFTAADDGVSADQPTSATEVQPRPYRNSFRSHNRKAEKAEKADTCSMLSRPTTAGADTASASSISWREEWTPGNVQSLEKPVGLLLRPLPSGSRKPPPLPPLPTRPPDSGSVFHASGSGALGPQPATSETTASEEASCPPDPAALRRISLSSNASAATPPPVAGAKRHAREAPIDTSSQENEVVSPGIDATGDVAGPNAADTTADAIGLNESLQSDFSELARAFTCMEVV